MGNPDPPFLIQHTPSGIAIVSCPCPHPGWRLAGGGTALPTPSSCGSQAFSLGLPRVQKTGSRLSCAGTIGCLMWLRGWPSLVDCQGARTEGTLYKETQGKVRGLLSCDKPHEYKPAVQLGLSFPGASFCSRRICISSRAVSVWSCLEEHLERANVCKKNRWLITVTLGPGRDCLYHLYKQVEALAWSQLP